MNHKEYQKMMQEEREAYEKFQRITKWQNRLLTIGFILVVVGAILILTGY